MVAILHLSTHLLTTHCTPSSTCSCIDPHIWCMASSSLWLFAAKMFKVGLSFSFSLMSSGWPLLQYYQVLFKGHARSISIVCSSYPQVGTAPLALDWRWFLAKIYEILQKHVLWKTNNLLSLASIIYQHSELYGKVDGTQLW